MSVWNPKPATGGMNYKGGWDASTAAYPVGPTVGDLYVITVDGTISGTPYVIGDQIIWNGATWDKLPTGATVVSVAGKTGAVTLAGATDLTDYATKFTGKNANNIPDWSSKVTWDDIRPGAIFTSTTGPNSPSRVVIAGGITGEAYSATIMNEKFVGFQLLHACKLGQIVSYHVHWMPENTGAGNVVWGAEWIVFRGGVSAPVTITKTVATPGARQEVITEIGTLDLSAFSGVTDLSITVAIRLYRDAANVADTYTGRVFLIDSDLHARFDTPGSEQELSK